MKRILVISWFFPPINSSEGLVTYKLLKNSKCKFDVFTQKENDNWSYSKTDYLDNLANVKSIYAMSTDLKEWQKEAIEYFEKNIDKYDIIMTRSMPEESHIVGLELKKLKPSVTWISSFGDPIADNPFSIKANSEVNPYSLANRYVKKMSFKYMLSPIRFLKSIIWKYRYDKRYTSHIKKMNKLQNEIILSSDYVICNNEYQKEYMSKRIKNEELENKFWIIPHSYDSTLYSNEKVQKENKIKFVYVGHLDDIRTPDLIFQALNKLQHNNHDLSNKVTFEFYGNLSDKSKLYLINNELLDVVKIKKGITYKESLRVMESSDWLIHIDANISELVDNNIFFAAKLSDYLGSKTKILGITMLEGASADILRTTNSLVISHSVEEIYNYLYLIIYEGYSIELNKKEAQKYDSIVVSKTFDDYIGKYAKNR